MAADRTVRIKLAVGGIREYTRDLATATAATELLRRETERLDGKRLRLKADVDTSSAIGQLRGLDRSATRATGSIRRMRGQLGSLHRLKVPAITVGGVTAAPGLASMVGSARELLGVVGLLPGVMMGGAAAIGVIAAGTRGFTDAVGGSAEAMAKLTPEARAAARELLSQADAWRGVARGAQAALFRGQAEQLDRFGKALLPVAAKGASDLATQLGAAAREFLQFASRADSVADAREGLALTADAASRLGSITVNLSGVIADLGVVGGRELPALADSLDAATGRLRGFVAASRANGDMARWIREGKAEASQLGAILRDTGGIMAGLGRAASGAGVDTIGALQEMADGAHRYIESWEGQARIRQTLAGIQADAKAFVPGLRDLAGAAADFVSNLSGSGTLGAAGTAFSSLAAAARPAVAVLSQLTGAVLRPLLATVTALAPALGPVAVGLIAIRGASSAIGSVQGRIDGLAGRFNNAAAAATGSATATSRVGTVLGGLSRSLPVIGLAIAGVAGGYELLRDKSDDAAASVLNGTATFTEAVNQTYGSMRTQAALFGEGGAAAVKYSDAMALTSARMQEQIDKMPPLQAAHANVTRAQALLNDAVSRYGPTSDAAAQGRGRLTQANREAEIQELATKLGVDAHTAALIRNRDLTLGASDAAIAWHASIDRATESVATNGRTLDLNTEQGRNNRTALNDMERAARAHIDATTELKGVTEETTGIAKAHEDQLFNTARQLGMTEEEARAYVDQLNLVPPRIDTDFETPGLDDAITKSQSLWDKLKGLAQNWSASVTPERHGGVMNPNMGRYATGGRITGPGTGTSDDVLMYGSAGEWVIRHRTVREQGNAAMAALNAGKADVVPKYARGGPIGGTVTIDYRKFAEHVGATDREMFPPMPPMPAGGGGGVGGGAARWAGVALQALAMLGQPASLLPRVLKQIDIESSGNPRAINLWDINARRGTPSMGLIQTIMPTYLANADPRRNLGPYDPLSNLLAGMRYAIRRYGSIAAIWPKTWGYANGGVIPGTGAKDDKLVLAQSGERVLTTGQNERFERLVDHLDRPTPASPASLSGGGVTAEALRPIIHQQIENHFTESVDLDVFNARQDFYLRAVGGFGG